MTNLFQNQNRYKRELSKDKDYQKFLEEAKKSLDDTLASFRLSEVAE